MSGDSLTVGRRETLKGLLAVLASFFTTGCEQSSEDAQVPQNRALRLAAVSEIGQGVQQFPLYRLAVVRYGNEVRAVKLVCTHQACVVRTEVGPNRSLTGFTCPCHGAAFDEKGEPVSGPAKVPLSWVSVERRGDDLYVYPLKTVSPETSLTL